MDDKRNYNTAVKKSTGNFLALYRTEGLWKKIVPDQENQRKEYLKENAIVEIYSPSLELAKQSA